MGYELSKKEIGERIANLRSKKGFSQQDLAKNIAISRSSLTQIELGNRGVSLSEMQKLSIVLGFSLDDFMTKDFLVNQSLQPSGTSQDEVISERISVPTLNVNKFKNILLYILERCAGKPNVGETVLYKLLYFSDFNYFLKFSSSGLNRK